MLKIFEKGQTLLEILIAISVGMVILSGIVVVVLIGLANAQFSKNQNLATQHAQEGMEVVRKLRDENWTTFTTYIGKYCLPKDSPPVQLTGSSCETNIDNFFTRTINFTWEMGGARVTAVVTVDWKDAKGIHTSNLVSYFTQYGALTELPTTVPTSLPTPTPGSGPTPTPGPDKYVFVTSQTYTGAAIGGLLGADAKCKQLADGVASLVKNRNWKAWLSGSTFNASPFGRFTKTSGNYKLASGEVVANGWSDLTDSDGLDRAINKDESGNFVGLPSRVWTNTKADSTPESAINTCGNWTNTTGDGWRGNKNISSFDDWTLEGRSSCISDGHLYCFEQ